MTVFHPDVALIAQRCERLGFTYQRQWILTADLGGDWYGKVSLSWASFVGGTGDRWFDPYVGITHEGVQSYLREALGLKHRRFDGHCINVAVRHLKPPNVVDDWMLRGGSSSPEVIDSVIDAIDTLGRSFINTYSDPLTLLAELTPRSRSDANPARTVPLIWWLLGEQAMALRGCDFFEQRWSGTERDADRRMFVERLRQDIYDHPTLTAYARDHARER